MSRINTYKGFREKARVVLENIMIFVIAIFEDNYYMFGNAVVKVDGFANVYFFSSIFRIA